MEDFTIPLDFDVFQEEQDVVQNATDAATPVSLLLIDNHQHIHFTPPGWRSHACSIVRYQLLVSDPKLQI